MAEQFSQGAVKKRFTSGKTHYIVLLRSRRGEYSAYQFGFKLLCHVRA